MKTRPWTWLELATLAAFLLWSAAGLIFALGHITPAVITTWHLPDPLGAFVQLCLLHGDPILILLAFTNTHLLAAHQWTARDARRWGVLVLLFSYAVEMIGVRTGLPFGEYAYTDRFGPVLFGVPVAIPLAWHVVLTNVLFIVRALTHFLPLTEAALGGILCMLYDFILEPFAKLKGYWVWTDGNVSPLNYPAWFIVSGLLIGLFAPPLMTRNRLDPRPWIILGLMIAIFEVSAS